MSREFCPISKVLWGRVQFIHSLLIIHSQSVILVSLICSHKIVEQTKCPTTEDVSPQIHLSILASLLELGEPLSLFCSVTCDILEAEVPFPSGLSLSLPTQAPAGVQGPHEHRSDKLSAQKRSSSLPDPW